MGQQPSKGIVRLGEINAELKQARKLENALLWPASEETAAGIPAVPCSAQARYAAVRDYIDRLNAEYFAVHDFLDAQREGRSMAMPDPTPPLNLLPPLQPAARIAPAPAPPACGVQPSTPAGGASPPRGQRGDSSSSGEEGAHAGDVENSAAMPLLVAGAKGLARGLRRRQGRHEGG